MDEITLLSGWLQGNWIWFLGALIILVLAVLIMYLFSRRHRKEQLTPLNNLEQLYHKERITEDEFRARRQKLLEKQQKQEEQEKTN